ncbi:hypothetical protein [Methylomagnum ishizawai]|uniref:hypothetical protein n=1 Tax=Methylomagnum ishizawai TaxID=1760988 RepID=UPI0015940B01|nr:hypothetical protein [Methylomagnum ishizawai]
MSALVVRGFAARWYKVGAPPPAWFLRWALPWLPLWFPDLTGEFAVLELRLVAMGG